MEIIESISRRYGWLVTEILDEGQWKLFFIDRDSKDDLSFF
ncbi:hypothetical protein [endosymbiont 'TC1' of Trimyema compressum]|nr:hypothetical protein [endosymbiont 'TC1' of Trimyema compressum]